MTARETGWIEWNGGECPVDLDTPVQVKLRGDAAPSHLVESAGAYRWDYGPSWNPRNDIIAYRVVEP